MMMIILRSPFRRRQAPQTSAAPQPFQHWPPDKVHQSHGIDHHNQNIQKIITLSKKKTSQELRMLSSVTINCQITKIVMKSGSQLSEL